MPPLPQPEQEGENTTFTFSEVTPGTATGTYDSTTGAVTLNDSLQLTFVGTGLEAITCVSTPINVAFSGTYDSTSQNVTLSASGFTIPDFPASSGENCGAAAPSLNASPGGVAGAVGNAMTLALNGNFSPLLPTTTTLVASPNSPQLAGTAVTMTATVTDPSATGTPTGTVNFLDNGTSLGTGTLSPSGTTGTATAALTTSSLPQTANQQLTAVYLGDTAYGGSTSAAVPYTIQALPTISSTFPSQFTAGDTSFPAPTPFTLTVTNPPGGASYANAFLYLGFSTDDTWDQAAMQFSYQDQAGNWCPLALSTDNGAPSGSGLPSAGVPGVFFGGVGTSPCDFGSSFSLAPGASATFNLEVSFSQEYYPANFYGPITLTTALQTGTCTSSSACTAVAPLMGKTSVTSQAASSIVPDAGVGTVPSVVTVKGTAGQTVRSGYQVVLQTQVAATTDVQDNDVLEQGPTGTVQFFIDSTLAATETLNSSGYLGAATTAAPYYPGLLTPGTHTETVNYPGDQLYAPSSASVTFTVIAGPPLGTPYTCQITSILGGTALPYDGYVTVSGGTGIPTAAFSGTSVTATGITVNLDLDAASGPAHYYQGSDAPTNGAMTFSPGNVSVDPGAGTWVNASPDTDTIGTFSDMSVTTTVSGNPGDVVPIAISSIGFSFGFQGAGSLLCTPAAQPAAVGSVAIIGTTLAVSPDGSAPVGAPVTLTATAAPLPPPPNSASGNTPVSPGTVDFYDGSTYLGTANVDPTAGTASLMVNTLVAGDHQLSAVWSGYSGVPPSSSNTVDYAVGTATTTSLASSANPANAANPITFTATVSPPLGALTQPTGDVSFTADGNPISSCQNVSLSMTSPPTATCTTSFAAGTTHSIVATYSGDGTYLGSASDPLTQTMLPGTNTTILSTKDPSPPGNVTFWSGVSPSSGKGATPTGTVAFTIDGATYKACNAQPLGPGGGASCTVSFKAGTTHKVFATYAGSASYSGSKSSTITQTVTGSKSSTTPKDTSGSATLASGKSLTTGQSIATGSYKLVMQSDGNLVEYQGSKALWASGTSGHPGTGVVMQKDGNLVEYQGGKAIWASNTSGHSGAHLTLQGSDGNVVIYGPAGNAVWNTGT